MDGPYFFTFSVTIFVISFFFPEETDTRTLHDPDLIPRTAPPETLQYFTELDVTLIDTFDLELIDIPAPIASDLAVRLLPTLITFVEVVIVPGTKVEIVGVTVEKSDVLMTGDE